MFSNGQSMSLADFSNGNSFRLGERRNTEPGYTKWLSPIREQM
jgi:hypothetical protein